MYDNNWLKILGEEPVKVNFKERFAAVAYRQGLAAAAVERTRIEMLLNAASRLPDAEFVALVVGCYEEGDTRERQAILCGLPLFPSPARFLYLASDACRSNIQPLFEALACENSYPSDYFSEEAMNHLVLKALAVGTPLCRIVGLARRLNEDLIRMAEAYAVERRAAGRSVSPDIGLLCHARNPV
jgi:hypothetical protein